MKKRKMSSHINIKIAKEQKKDIKYSMKQGWFTHSAICIRDIFGPRLKQKRRMYLYLERKDNQLCKS